MTVFMCLTLLVSAVSVYAQGQLPVTGGSGTGTGGTGTGTGTGAGSGPGFNLNIKPPSQYRDLKEVIDAISGYLVKIAIPIAIIMIVYAGVRFLMARGDPKEVSAAKDILKYAIIGLAIVLIGKGFVTLVNSILGVNPPTSP